MNYDEMSIEELLDAYAEMFDDNFPVFGVASSGDEELRAIIIECLRTGEPAKAEYMTGDGIAY